MHFHGPAQSGQNAGVQMAIPAPLNSPVHGTTGQLSDEQVKQLLDSDWYVNVHTKANPGGEIRGHVLHGGPLAGAAACAVCAAREAGCVCGQCADDHLSVSLERHSDQSEWVVRIV
jgi:hypothetical protein